MQAGQLKRPQSTITGALKSRMRLTAANYDGGLPKIIGNDVALRRVLRRVRVAGPAGATVLIEGETGAGTVIGRSIFDEHA